MRWVPLTTSSGTTSTWLNTCFLFLVSCFFENITVWGESLSGGSPWQRHTVDRDPPQTEPPLQGQRPPWTETPWSCDLCCMLGQRHPPCEQNDWQTIVKTLPCRNFVAGGNNTSYWSQRLSPSLFISRLPSFFNDHQWFQWESVKPKFQTHDFLPILIENFFPRIIKTMRI